MMHAQSIVLIGMAGVGKSTVGRLLSQRLGWEFVDVDQIITEDGGRTPQQIIDADGESAFLQREKQTMFAIDLDHRVLAPGGSIIYHTDLMEYLKARCVLIYLKDTLENIRARTPNQATRGIVGLRDKSFKEVFEEREHLYAQYAHMTISVDQAPGAIAAQIATRLKRLLP